MEDLMISLLLKANDSFWYLLSRQRKKNRGLEEKPPDSFWGQAFSM